MKFKDSERIQEILMEMPRWSKPIGGNTFEYLSKLPIDVLRSNTKHVFTDELFEIRRAEDQYRNTIQLYIKSDILMAGYSFGNSTGYIKTISSWNNPSHRGSFYKVFERYIIPTFHTIESDNKLTDLGYKFWKKLIEMHPELHYYVKKKNNNYGKVFDVSQLDKFFGHRKEHLKSAFVVSDKEL